MVTYEHAYCVIQFCRSSRSTQFRLQSSSLLCMTEEEKSSGKPWDGSGSDWFSVRTMKTLLIGQSVTCEKYERTTGSWREKESAYSGKFVGKERALKSRLSRGETVYRAAAMSETPKKPCNTNVKICRCCNTPLISVIVYT